MPGSTEDTIAASMGRTPDASASRRGNVELSQGTVVGRYVVLGRLGAGAMGVVYAAYDPELDRKVALKLLHPESAGGTGEASTRLQREAQALARLSHRNVVAVYDVGRHGERVYVAMEHVVGRTLRAWLAEERPRAREVLARFIHAGEGLQAAHAAGILHRDFKPDNVMIASDGRIVVMDFGLARAIDAVASGASPREGDIAPSSSTLSAELTRDGSLVGTPAYLAAELFHGEAAGPAADQYAFCVSLYEGLYGTRPYPGSSIAQLSLAVTEGRLASTPRGVRVPGWLRRTIVRGLAPEPSARWPSMERLLAELRADPARRRAAALGATALVVASAGIWGGRELWVRQATQDCADAAASALAIVWNDEVRTALGDTFRATQLSFADAAWSGALAWLDRYSGGLVDARTRVCIAERVDESRSPQLSQRASACLAERQLHFAALLARLEAGSVEAVAGAITAAADLPSVADCEDDRQLEARPWFSSEMSGAGELSGFLAESAAALAAGQHAEALRTAERAAELADGTGAADLRARAGLALGSALEATVDYERATVVLERGFAHALEGGAEDVAAATATMLVFVADRRARNDEALQWGNVAAALLHHPDVRWVGAPQEADLLHSLANVHSAAGSHADAIALYGRALEIVEETLGAEHPKVASIEGSLGLVLKDKGDFDSALEHYERARALDEATFGPDHPRVAATLTYVGNVLELRGGMKQAEAQYLRALSIFERARGPEHPDVAMALLNLGDLHRARAEYPQAITRYQRGLQIIERVHGPDHPDVAAALVNLAMTYRAQGVPDRAAPLMERALSIRERALGPDHADVGLTLHNLGNVLRDRGDLDAAQRNYDRALAILERSLGPTHLFLAYPLTGITEVRLGQGRPGLAIATAERALSVRESARADPGDIALARFRLARALWESGSDRPRALSLAEQARDTFAADPSSADDAAEIDAWLRASRRRP